MILPKHLTSEIDFTNILAGLVQTYQQIYVKKMQRTRESVLETRHFIDSISQTYSVIKSAFLQLMVVKGFIARPTQLFPIPGVKKSKDTILVFLSASEKLSGKINMQVFNFFWHFLEEYPLADLVIAGKTGKRLYEQRGGTRPFRYYDLPEESLTVEDLRPIINLLLDYRKVNVIYGKFHSFVNQQPAQTNVSGQSTASISQESQPADLLQPASKYLFEPSPEEILQFFETQIFTSLFKQTVSESYLAQIGSRVMTLESSSANINLRLQALANDTRRYVRRQKNRKQMQSFSGISLWYR